MIRRAIRRFTNGRALGADARAEGTPTQVRRDGEAPRRDSKFHVPRIVITRGPGIGRGASVPTKCTIGRAPESDIVVQDPGVSGRHAFISLQGDAYVIQDLGSRNGTIVNGRSVRAATLQDDDVIRLGHVELRFLLRKIVAGTSPAHAPPAAAAPASFGTGPAPAGEKPWSRPALSLLPARSRRWGS